MIQKMTTVTPLAKSASVYTPLTLKLYDVWVLGISNRFAWQCPTWNILLPFFRKHMGKKHLDVGVGTGFYPAHTRIASHTEITLLDMNGNSLNAAKKRIGNTKAACIRHDIMQPLPFQGETMFDSISLFYVLHCLSGSFAEKGKAIGHLKRCLAPDGTLYGATILGEEAHHNWLGSKLMKLYNRKGIFGNHQDTEKGLQAMLQSHFSQVEIRRHGKVALFTARNVHA